MPFFDEHWTPCHVDLPDEPPCPLVDLKKNPGCRELALVLSKIDFDWIRDQLILAPDPAVAALRLLVAMEAQAAAQHDIGFIEALQRPSDTFLARLAVLDSLPPDSSKN